MILLAMSCSLARSSRFATRSAVRAIPKAVPMACMVSGSNRWLSRYGRIGWLWRRALLPAESCFADVSGSHGARAALGGRHCFPFFSLLEDRKAHDLGITGRGAFALQASVAERPVALPPETRGNAMSTVEEYHKSARDCLRWAAKARTGESSS